MKVKAVLLGLMVGAALAVSAQADPNLDRTSNRKVASSSQSRTTAPASGATSGARFGGGHIASRSPSFSSINTRSMPAFSRFREQQRLSAIGNGSTGQRRFTPEAFNRERSVGQFENGRHFRTMQSDRFAQIQRDGANPEFGDRRRQGLAQLQGDRGNPEVRNRKGERVEQFENRRGNRTIAAHELAPGRNHVFDRRSWDWHRDWDRGSDHWWNGHRCRFIAGSWIIFDIGFTPWYGYPYYPYDYYASDYYYPYYYPYSYDPAPYSSDPGVYESGNYDYGYEQNAYDSYDQDASPTVAAVQQELARQNYYHGEIDGILGPETRRAISRYQAYHGLEVSGYLTRETLESLGLQRLASY